MNTLDAIAKRCSCRVYKPEQLKDEDLKKIIEAGNAAPVGMGKYDTLKFTVVQDKGLIEKIDGAGASFFAKQGIDIPHPLCSAPTFIMVSGAAGDITPMNTACVIENMIIEATDLGVGSCYIMGNVAAIKGNEGFKAALRIPEGFEMVSGLILGYPAEEPAARELVTDKIAAEYIK
ncbi:nitroreductase family protein [Aminicella lysinilytica]|uniref:Nitroreductase n=1 Tax=Aminicella lysinilytica TaxID=433323 RepID=A0A4R6Q2R6_9FIRM|nr:nitroreductase family protein [Aminicella lysinilytica]TDP56299.1 nitroreductase [Aminicella lysinilytica]